MEPVKLSLGDGSAVSGASRRTLADAHQHQRVQSLRAAAGFVKGRRVGAKFDREGNSFGSRRLTYITGRRLCQEGGPRCNFHPFAIRSMLSHFDLSREL